MKAILFIIGAFLIGILVGKNSFLPAFIMENDLSNYALYLLLFMVGLSIGGDSRITEIFRFIHIRTLLIPLVIIVGAYCGVLTFSLFFSFLTIREGLAIASGFGYYSLSGIMLMELADERISVIALLSNIIREIFTLLFAPLLAKYFGKLSTIGCGGATSMDTTLPVIVKFSGREYAIIAIFSGLVLSLLVPMLISLLYN
jgi:uncharacterized membrane protein YbjE (DUF340 family)